MWLAFDGRQTGILLPSTHNKRHDKMVFVLAVWTRGCGEAAVSQLMICTRSDGGRDEENEIAKVEKQREDRPIIIVGGQQVGLAGWGDFINCCSPPEASGRLFCCKVSGLIRTKLSSLHNSHNTQRTICISILMSRTVHVHSSMTPRWKERHGGHREGGSKDTGFDESWSAWGDR